MSSLLMYPTKTLFPEVFNKKPKSLCVPLTAQTFSVQGLFHLHQCNLILSLVTKGSAYFFQSNDGISSTDTNIAEGSSGEGVDLTYSNLIRVFFWCRHCSLLSGVSVDSPCASLLCAWEYCCYSRISPMELRVPCARQLQL